MSDDLEIVGGAEKEARLVAVLLGEASDFEREEVLRMCESDGEMAVLKCRLEAVHGLLEEDRLVNQLEPTKWKLEDEKRSEILSQITAKEGPMEEGKKVVALKKKKRRSLAPTLALAAILAIGCLGFSVLTIANSPASGRVSIVKKSNSGFVTVSEQEIVAYEGKDVTVSPKSRAVTSGNRSGDFAISSDNIDDFFLAESSSASDDPFASNDYKFDDGIFPTSPSIRNSLWSCPPGVWN